MDANALPAVVVAELTTPTLPLVALPLSVSVPP
jgi:hypothetical protein